MSAERPMLLPVHALALTLALVIGCGAEPAEEPRPAPPPEEPAAPPPAPTPDWIDVDAESLEGALRARPEPLLLVNVWSTWCAPCVEEMPDVIATARRYAPRGLGLVLIAADAPSNREAALAFLRERGAPLPSWFKRGSDDAFVRAVHPEWSGALPVTLLYDRERRVRHVWFDPVDEAALRGPIESLLPLENGEGT
ncbi:MAG: TlpA family protein disulfide reductase [Sandaracinaceae bacterium]|nr:TlpA family protein disulfide reductase [Sandaracinaceae bacterium]